MAARLRRLIIRAYSYRVKISARKFRVVKVKKHIQRMRINDKTLHKNYAYNKKLNAWDKKRRIYNAVYFLVLKYDSEVLFKNTKYAASKNSIKYILYNAFRDPELVGFLAATNAIKVAILSWHRFYSLNPYIKWFNVNHYSTYSKESGFTRQVKGYIKKYKMQEVKLTAKQKELIDIFHNQYLKNAMAVK